MISHPRRHCVVALQALPPRIGQVRRIVSAQLRHWQLDPLIDRAALGVTELLSNVHRHARPDKACRVEIELRLGRLTVSVHDNDPTLPVARAADQLDTCGRGLALIEAVSESWGARPEPDRPGKVVWFSLRAAPAPTFAPAPDPAVAAAPAQALTAALATTLAPDPAAASPLVTCTVRVRAPDEAPEAAPEPAVGAAAVGALGPVPG
ncbi:ATP-binding protein [Streptomyces sp. G-G2]|uniref:ATP-binding protein n=1 Tax=Streptomyces sp. G-G2 TaxID=3046201 RepID=UPI0024B9C5D7|nr:ATP-binding protein [Streptomyces sp. G-G2]MDJ0381202.1 ATP-binding protein [Streptomyces sp. G-G2]